MRDKATYLSESSPSVRVSSPLFADLDSATIALSVAYFTEEVWPAGHIVFEELAPGDTLYIIMDGQVQISRTFQGGARRVIREMGSGEFFGEMALLEDKPRSARVSTVKPTTFLAVTRQRFNTLIEQHPAVAINFLKAISAQLRQQYQEQAVLLEEKETLVEALAAKNAALEQALAELRTALVTVAEHERVKRDLEIAREIQRQMLPATFPQAPGLCLHATTVGLLCQRNLRFSWFVTVQYVVLDVRQRHMQFICAGHPPILLRHADGQLEHLGAALNIPLGVEETFAYHQEERQLMAGDTLLLYSDGTYERQDMQGGQLGLARLERLFAAAPSYPEAAVHTIQAALDTFSDVGGAKDDTTLLCAQIL